MCRKKKMPNSRKNKPVKQHEPGKTFKMWDVNRLFFKVADKVKGLGNTKGNSNIKMTITPEWEDRSSTQEKKRQN